MLKIWLRLWVTICPFWFWTARIDRCIYKVQRKRQGFNLLGLHRTLFILCVELQSLAEKMDYFAFSFINWHFQQAPTLPNCFLKSPIFWKLVQMKVKPIWMSHGSKILNMSWVMIHTRKQFVFAFLGYFENNK